MICLTGDLHHMSLQTGNQKHCDISEMRVARRYLKRLESAQVKVTFFISGKSFAEEWEDVQPICESPYVEVGGHNYSCFTPVLYHRICKKLLGSYNGPLWHQRRDARKTIGIIREKTGKTIRCWRNHMYMHGPHTEKALTQAGIQVCSDEVNAQAMGPYWHPSGLLQVPINIIPDHEHLYHAERTPEWVKWWLARYHWSDDFGPQSYHVEEWTEIVLEGLRKNEERGAISTLIIHPITLYLCDGLKSFEKILAFIQSRETKHLSEIYDREAQKLHEQGGSDA